MQEQISATHEGGDSKLYAGFWLYLMTDVILFGTLFATYAVLHGNTAGGPTSQQIFELPRALKETFLMISILMSTALAMHYAPSKKKMVSWFGVAFVLALVFSVMTFVEYDGLIRRGITWKMSGFLSSYYTLSGLHLLHVLVGMLWTVVLLRPVIHEGMTPVSLRRLHCLRTYWQFLAIVWIFVFTLIYLPGVL